MRIPHQIRAARRRVVTSTMRPKEVENLRRILGIMYEQFGQARTLQMWESAKLYSQEFTPRREVQEALRLGPLRTSNG